MIILDPIRPDVPAMVFALKISRFRYGRTQLTKAVDTAGQGVTGQALHFTFQSNFHFLHTT